MRPTTARRWIQIIILGCVLLLFLQTSFPLRSLVPVDLLMRLDPLAAVITFVSDRAIIPRMLLSLVILGLTVAVGRFFCGYICPLGTVIDLSDGLLFKGRGGPIPQWTRSLKFYILLILLITAIFGLSLVWLVDPLAIFLRSLTVLLYPAATLLATLGLDLIRPLAERLDLVSLAYFSPQTPHYVGNLGIFLVFVVILSLSLFGTRFWCRTLCPLGAFLAATARWGIFQRRIDGSCLECRICQRVCPMGAIPQDIRRTEFGECIQCQLCASACPQGAIQFKAGKPTVPRGTRLSRRRLLYSSLFGLAAVSVAKINPFPLFRSSRLVRPPGALPEQSFLARCLRCGECLKVCLTNGLQPATYEASWEGLWTPVLVPRLGGCERDCHLCGQVCPSQAIRALSLEEKSYARLGTATIARERCIAWEQDRRCLICDEACPYGAIDFREVKEGGETFRRPVVAEEVCIGCGICEQRCPVEGEAAIVVTTMGEERLSTGSYITPQKIRSRERAKKVVGG